MMEVTVDQVKAFRKMTGYGMMDCKKALLECNGNEDLAIEYLKRKPYRLVCGKMPASRVNDCMFCNKEVCENIYDSESMVCKTCLVKKCMDKEN